MTAAGLSEPYEIPIHLILLNDQDGTPPDPSPIEKMQVAINGANTIFDGLMSFYLCEVTSVNDSYYYDQPAEGGDVETNLFPVYNQNDAVNVYLARSLGSAVGLRLGRLFNGPENAGVLLGTPSDKALAHELGHYFTLLHTHEFTVRYNSTILNILPDNTYNHYSDPDFSRCLCCDCEDSFGTQLFCVDPDCPEDCICTASNYGDFIADTNVDPGTVFCSGTPCPRDIVDPSGQVVTTVVYDPPTTNIMSYYSQMAEFSDEQKDKMLRALMTHGGNLIANNGANCQTFPEPVYLPDGYVFRPVYDEINQEYVFLPLEGFEIKIEDLSSNESTTSASSLDGKYIIESDVARIVEDKDIEVGAQDNNNNTSFGVREGVTTLDQIRLQRHILGIEPLPSPYALIAADVNNSKSVTTLDQIILQRIILGLLPNFEMVSNFRVVPKYALAPQWGFAEPFEDNPFEAVWMDFNNEDRPYKAEQGYPHSYLEPIPLKLLNPDVLLEDTWTFYAVKSGDVTFDFDPYNAPPPLEYGLTAEPHDCISIDDNILVSLSLSEEQTLEGFQLGLAFDPAALSLTSVEQGELTPFGADYISAKEEGKLAALWYNQDEEPLDVEDGKVFCKLYLNAKQEICDIKDHISIDNSLLRAEIYCNGIAKPLEGKNLKLEVEMEVPKIIVGQVYPNPTTGQVTIPFELTEPGTLTIQLMDTYGGNLQHQAAYDDGQYEYTFHETSHLQPGVLYYQLEINGNVAAGSVIKH